MIKEIRAVERKLNRLEARNEQLSEAYKELVKERNELTIENAQLKGGNEALKDVIDRFFEDEDDELPSEESSVSEDESSTPPLLSKNDIQWVVNDRAELGIKIGNQFFWLYKGDSLVYDSGKHDDGTPIRWRLVDKHEFGECCHPVHLQTIPERYTEGDGWQPLPTPEKPEDQP